MVKICVAGATGRMGRAIMREMGDQEDFELVGAIASEDNENLGSSLRALGIGEFETRIEGPTKIMDTVKNADVYISFTTPEAEMANLPIVASTGTRIVMGTTGFSEEQMLTLREEVTQKVPAVFAPNFSLGIVTLYRLLESMKRLPEEYDFSIVELHHRCKKDAPSGTASRLAEIISGFKGYNKIVSGRHGVSVRQNDELEVSSIRAGGVPGFHEVLVAGNHELLRIQHTAFSKTVFTQGALYAAKWVIHQEETGLYSMEDVLF
jgi:4-hydroxy-tetrahydrodipicolinate reductase